MELINRYVAAVGKHLSLVKGREDILKELQSTLEDMLEDRASSLDREPDSAMEADLLREYGSPEKVANSYHQHQYLIGPRMYPIFLKVLKIVLAVVGSVALVGLFISLAKVGFSGGEFASLIMKAVTDYIGTAITVFGNIAVVFIILERTLPDNELKDFEEKEDWDPSTLPAVDTFSGVKTGDLIAEIVFSLIGLAILNGIFEIPIFTEKFRVFVPWLNLIFLAEIVLDVYLLRTSTWDTLSRVVKIGIEAAGVALTVIFIRTPGLFVLDSESAAEFAENMEQLGKIVTTFDISVSIALIVVLIIQGIELAKAVYGLLRVNYRTK